MSDDLHNPTERAATLPMPAAWYHADGDPPGTKRYWDGERWMGEPQVLPAAAGPMSAADELDLASQGQRLGGRLIDFFISLVITLAFAAIVLLPGLDFDAISDAIDGDEDIPSEALPGIGAFALFGIFYVVYPFLWDLVWVAKKGATPGKLLVGTRVASLPAAIWPPGWVVAAKRALNRAAVPLALIPLLGILVSLGLLGMNLVSLVFIFSDDRRQTVMDKIAGTVVVRKAG